MHVNSKCHFCSNTDLKMMTKTYACKLVCGNDDFEIMVKNVESKIQSPYTTWCNNCLSVFVFSSWCEKQDSTEPVRAEGLLATLALYQMLNSSDKFKCIQT